MTQVYTEVRGIYQRVNTSRKNGWYEARVGDEAKKVQRALKAQGYEAGQYQGWITTNAPLNVFAAVLGR